MEAAAMTHRLPSPRDAAADAALLSTASGATGPASSAGQVLRLALGEHRYAVGIEHVREILKVTQLTALPLMPPFVRGVMNLRGAVVPVIDLGARLGLGEATLQRRSCVVIVEVLTPAEPRSQTLGLLVDAVHEVADVPASGLEAAPPLGTDIAVEYLDGMARLRGEIVPVLALARVLDEDTLAAEISAHARIAPAAPRLAA
jgi:purine-binding chemotaxis protein CheW